MTHTLRLPIVRMFAYFLRKVFRQMFQGIHVDERGLEMVRKAYSQGPLVLIPTHRSYLDFLIVSYIFFEYDMPLPHIGAGEDFLGIFFVNWVFRNSGAFFLRRSFKGDDLYTSLFSEYVQRLVCDWSPIEFFIEGKRSRTGKSLHPKFGLLHTSLEPFFARKVPDVTVVPISIAYEKVVEGELHTNELMGEKKVKESFEGLLSARKVLQQNFGRINVVFNEPVSVKKIVTERTELLAKGVISVKDGMPMTGVTPRLEGMSKSVKFDPFHNETDQRQLVSDVAYRVVTDLNKGIVVTTTSIVATVLLNQRKGISYDDLLTKADWLREEISQRGSGVACEGITQDLVDNGLKLLSSLVMNVRNVYSPFKSLERGKKNKSILVLDLYRNQLIHIFPKDGMVAIALCSDAAAHEQGVPKEKLLKDCQFLSKLFWLEFVTKPDINVDDDFAQVLQNLKDRGIVKEINGNIVIAKEGDGFLAFLCNMFWPLVDCYWVASMALYAMHPNVNLKLNNLLQRTQMIAEKLFSEGKLPFYESTSNETLLNAFHLLAAWKVIHITAEQTPAAKKGAPRAPAEPPTVSLTAPFQKEENLSELVQKIQSLRKPGEIVDNPNKLKRAMIYDFPILAKL
jgi:glycerol-3-phosphate O-acyltransferase